MSSLAACTHARVRRFFRYSITAPRCREQHIRHQAADPRGPRRRRSKHNSARASSISARVSGSLSFSKSATSSPSLSVFTGRARFPAPFLTVPITTLHARRRARRLLHRCRWRLRLANEFSRPNHSKSAHSAPANLMKHSPTKQRKASAMSAFSGAIAVAISGNNSATIGSSRFTSAEPSGHGSEGKRLMSARSMNFRTCALWRSGSTYLPHSVCSTGTPRSMINCSSFPTSTPFRHDPNRSVLRLRTSRASDEQKRECRGRRMPETQRSSLHIQPFTWQPGQPISSATSDAHGVGAMADAFVFDEHKSRSQARRVVQLVAAHPHNQVHIGFVREW